MPASANQHVVEVIAAAVIEVIYGIENGDALDWFIETMQAYVDHPDQLEEVGDVFWALAGHGRVERDARLAGCERLVPHVPGLDLHAAVLALSDQQLAEGCRAWLGETDHPRLPQGLMPVWSGMAALLGAEWRRRQVEIALLRRTWQADRDGGGWWGSPDDMP